MSPVEIPRSKGKTRRIEFIEDCCYVGVNYGPNYQAKVAEVRGDWARYFVRNGKARYVETPTEPESPAAEAAGEEADGENAAEGGEGEGETEDAEGEGGAGAEDGTEGEGEPDPDALPEDFPHVAELAEAEITTRSQLEAVVDLTDLPGIGAAKAKAIQEALEAEAAGEEADGD